MSKPKKSSKTDSKRIPQPIKVKKEKTEEDRALHSMAHYVDDRLELVKQIFGSLKTKTITNLAPEYLKEKEMEEIQELCLNELLCLSKKRLLSIIDATKCPTDTESSDENSDVEAKEEHVSLEEISSDSEIENGGGKSSKKPKKNAKNEVKKANQAEDKTAPTGQMSVLELLELQARARAIRSQLALEPVTKIEVDSDDEPEAAQTESTTAGGKEKKNDNQTAKKLHSKRVEKSSTASKDKHSKSGNNKSKDTLRATVIRTPLNEAPSVGSTADSQISKQKIKIKRNFRNGNRTEESTKTIENSADETGRSAVEKPPNSQDVKKERSSRSPSPDVIPIVADTEVLSISDSSSDEEDNTLEKSNASKSSDTTHIDEETEDGEIVEPAVDKEATRTKHKNSSDQVESSEKVDAENSNVNSSKEACEPAEETETLATTIETPLESAASQQQHVSDAAKQTPEVNEAANTTEVSSLIRQSPLLNDNHGDDHSDDVISIEGGDLENEMSEHLDEDASSKNSNQSAAAPAATNNSNDADVVSLDSSENDDEDVTAREAESWKSRYMRSSKVHKVLAVSRLGKRVRDNLKTSKRSKKESDSDRPSKDERSKSSKYSSKHEDGSVDQYKELIQMSQRKN